MEGSVKKYIGVNYTLIVYYKHDICNVCRDKRKGG